MKLQKFISDIKKTVKKGFKFYLLFETEGFGGEEGKVSKVGIMS